MGKIRFNPEQFTYNSDLNWLLLEAHLHLSREPNSHPKFESPRTLPKTLLLPPSSFGDLISSIIRQNESDPQVEESQFVGTQWNSKLFENTTPLRGNPQRTAAKHEIFRWFKKNPTSITYWHTHTEFKSPYMTMDDLSRSIIASDRAILSIVGTPKYIWCLVKTKQVPKNNRSVKEMISEEARILEEIEDIYDTDQRPPNFSALASYLENKGYALYVWFDTDGLSVKNAYESGVFEKGIPLIKVTDDPDSELQNNLHLHAKNHLARSEDMPTIPEEKFLEFLARTVRLSGLVSRIRQALKGK